MRTYKAEKCVTLNPGNDTTYVTLTARFVYFLSNDVAVFQAVTIASHR